MSGETSPGFLDTSVVIRYITGHPPEMAERAARLMDSERHLVLSEVALLETAHVLTKYYGVPRLALVDALVALIQKANLRMATLPKTRVVEALHLCRDSHRYSLPDVILWAQAREMKVEPIFTFDRRFPSQSTVVAAPT